MRAACFASAVVLCSVVGGAGIAQQATPRTYMTAETMPDAARIMLPAPASGSPRDVLDMQVHRQTRALEGTERWALAQADNSYQVPYLLQAFSCAANTRLTPQNAPTAARILGAMLTDQNLASRTAKDVFKRPRPYLAAGANICIPKTDSLAASPDYPSGHATLGWAAGMILAEVAPARAEQILTRARAYGESRVVCGVHTPSAVEAGRLTGAIVVTAMHGSERFRNDLDTARAELAAAAADPVNAVDPAACQREFALTGATPWVE